MSAGAEISGWSRGRFLFVTGTLFLLQVGAIVLFAERTEIFRPLSRPLIRFSFLNAPLREEDLAKYIFAADPTVFPLSSAHGFSGQAWMSIAPDQYDLPEQSEPPQWLALDTSMLTASMVAQDSGPPQIPFDVADPAGPQLEPTPIFLPPEMARDHSVFHLEGPLAGRQIGGPVALATVQAAQPAGNSVIEIGVNRSGQIVSARFNERSGVSAADADALSAVWGMRFKSGTGPGPDIAWGKAVFEWHTVEPPATSIPAP